MQERQSKESIMNMNLDAAYSGGAKDALMILLKIPHLDGGICEATGNNARVSRDIYAVDTVQGK